MKLVPPLKCISAIKVAVKLCNEKQFKREILCVRGSEYDKKKQSGSTFYELQWSCVIKNKSENLIKALNLPKQLQEDIVRIIQLVAKEMLWWCRYHKLEYALPHSYTERFLNESLFTSQGRINKRKAAEKLMTDEILTKTQRYTLACGYMFTNDIVNFWNQMSEDERETFYDIDGPEFVTQPQIAQLWSYYLLDKLQDFLGRKEMITHNSMENFWKLAFEISFRHGNDIATTLAWEKLCPTARDRLIVDTALEALDEIDETVCTLSTTRPHRNFDDILYFLLSKMTKEEKIDFLRKDIELRGYSRILEYLLTWYHADVLMQTAQLMWEFLPKHHYAKLLIDLLYNTEKTTNFSNLNGFTMYNYNDLFKQFWKQCPRDFKKHVFRSKVLLDDDIILREHRESIKWMLKDATADEKLHLIFTNGSRMGLFLTAFTTGDHHFAKWLLQNSRFLPENDRKKQLQKELYYFAFESDLIVHGGSHPVSAVVELVEMCLESEKDINEFKRKLAEDRGKKLCSVLWIESKLQEVENYLSWSYSTQEEQKEFRKILFQYSGVDIYYQLLIFNKFHTLQLFFMWFESNDDEIRQLKRDTLLKYIDDGLMYYDFLHGTQVTQYSNVGDKKRACEMLMWCITDKDMVSEIRDHFKQKYNNNNNTCQNEKVEIVFKEFDLLIEQISYELDIKELHIKRNYEHLPDNLPPTKKKHCNGAS